MSNRTLLAALLGISAVTVLASGCHTMEAHKKDDACCAPTQTQQPVSGHEHGGKEHGGN